MKLSCFSRRGLRGHVHVSISAVSIAMRVVVDQSSFRQKQGGVLGCPIVVPLGAASPLDFPDDWR